MRLDYFDKIFVINLPSRADRRKEIDHQLRRLGLSLLDERVVLFPAVRPNAAGAFPSIGAHGCFMSHLGVLRMAQTHGMNNILILEDDCDFSKHAKEQTPLLMAALQQFDWALFYGGALNTFEAQPLYPDLELVNASAGLMGSHCVAVAGGVVSQLITYFEAMLKRPAGSPEGGPMHVDGAYSWFRKDHPELATVIARPEWAFQRSSATDVHERRWFDRVAFLGPVFSVGRRIRNLLR